MARHQTNPRARFAEAAPPPPMGAEELPGTDGTETEISMADLEWNGMDDAPRQAKAIWVTWDLETAVLANWHQTRSFQGGRWREDGHFVLANTKLRIEHELIGWLPDNGNYAQIPGENGGLVEQEA